LRCKENSGVQVKNPPGFIEIPVQKMVMDYVPGTVSLSQDLHQNGTKYKEEQPVSDNYSCNNQV